MKTETQTPEQRIQELESRRGQLRTIIDNIPDSIYVKDLESRFVNANIQMAKQFDQDSVKNLLGRTIFDFCEPEYARQSYDDEQRIFKTGTPVLARIETKRDRDNNLISVLESKIPTRDENGTITGLVGISRDVTDITIARQKLIKKSEDLKARNDEVEFKQNQLQTLIDNIPDFIYFKDRQSRFLNGNNQFYQGFNAKSMDELIGMSDLDFLPKKLASGYMKDEQKMMETGIPISKEEDGLDKDGEPMHLQTRKTPIRNLETNEIVGFVGISRNVTELTKARNHLAKQAEELREQKEELSQTLATLKQAQTKLVHSEKMASLGVLTAGIAHEINNPINFVYAGVNSIVKDFEDIRQVVTAMRKLKSANDPKKAIEELEEIQKQYGFDDAFEALEETLFDIKLGATRITEIVAGLSKFSRMGKESWQVSNIHDDLDSVLILLKNKYKSNVKIEKRYNATLPEIECFPSKLNQAFMNLVCNAIDAVNEKGESGTIIISTDHNDHNVYISIKDDGIGMSKKTRSKILDPFFTTKEIGKGVGLGLAIANSIVEDHEATLTIHTKEGVGSEFKIALPIRQRTENNDPKRQ